MRSAGRNVYVLTAIAAVIASGALTASIPTAPAAAATQCAPSADGVTPSLAVQDACGNHAMGAEIPGTVSNTGDGQPATPATSGASTATAAPRVQSQAVSPMATPSTGSNVLGFDISGFQPTTDWATAVKDNYKFVFMKATEGTGYVSSYFTKQWAAAGAHNLIRGAYHFMQPTQSSGAAQADYFYIHGAAMSTKTPGTLPPVLDAENSNCAGMSQTAMSSWILSFMNRLKALTGRTPIIYTYQSWWTKCTGGNRSLAALYPLWVADPTPPSATKPRLPSGWSGYTFWQWGAPPFSGGGDANVYKSSSLPALQAYASYARIAGTDRWATSVNAAQSFLNARTATPALSPKPANTVYIASGNSFADALSGGGAAGLQKAPIMLVSATAIPPIVAAELSNIRPQNIVILGGTSAVGTSVQNALAKYSASGSSAAVRRIGGADRYATSAAVATSVFTAGVGNVYIASGANWPDALSGGGAAASPTSAGPVLLVQPGSVPATTAAALSKLKPKKITILGGPSAVSAGVASQLAKYTSSTIGRLSGSDRWATSAAIAANRFSAGVPVAYVASGVTFPDALSGAPMSALTGGAPVLLTQTGSVPSATITALKKLKPKSVVVLGGSSAVTAYVQSVLASYVVQ